MGEHSMPGQDGEPVPAVDVVDTADPRPEPVLDAATVAGVIAAVILGIGGVLKLVGVLVPVDYDLQGLADQVSNMIFALAAAWALFGPWITARLRARDQVTPLSDPRDAAGRKLIPYEEL